MTILANLSPSSSHLHPLQVENRDSDSRLVVDEDDNHKFRPERVQPNIETEKVILAKYIKIRILYLQLLLSRAPNGDCTTLIVDNTTDCHQVWTFKWSIFQLGWVAASGFVFRGVLEVVVQGWLFLHTIHQYPCGVLTNWILLPCQEKVGWRHTTTSSVLNASRSRRAA